MVSFWRLYVRILDKKASPGPCLREFCSITQFLLLLRRRAKCELADIGPRNIANSQNPRLKSCCIARRPGIFAVSSRSYIWLRKFLPVVRALACAPPCSSWARHGRRPGDEDRANAVLCRRRVTKPGFSGDSLDPRSTPEQRLPPSARYRRRTDTEFG